MDGRRVIDSETQAAIDGLRAEIASLRRDQAHDTIENERRVVAIEQRMDRWAINGLRLLDTGNAFAGTGGAFGTSTRFKRSDGT